MAHIIVLAGGTSDERAVSIRSGAEIAKALEAAEHQVTVLDPADDTIDYLELLREADAVFPALHGLGGEDGSLQALLESADIKYIGSDSLSSALCFDKVHYAERLQKALIAQPVAEMVDHTAYQNSALAKQPHVLKPRDGGSSIDTYVINDLALRDEQLIAASFQKHGQLLLQELIDGIEITVGVLLDNALPVIEIIPPVNEEFDYENKYNGATQELCPPKNVPVAVQQLAQSLAVEIHQLTGCRHFSRTDMIMKADGELIVLETNTIPGFTAQSLFPKAAAQHGHTMPSLVDLLVQEVMSAN